MSFTEATVPPVGLAEPVSYAAARFDNRAAAVMCAAVALEAKDKKGNPVPMRNRPPIKWEPVDGKLVPAQPWHEDRDLSEFKWYDNKAPSIFLLLSKCLPAMAYLTTFRTASGPRFVRSCRQRSSQPTLAGVARLVLAWIRSSISRVIGSTATMT